MAGTGDIAVFVGVGVYEDPQLSDLPDVAEEINLVSGALRRNGFTTGSVLSGAVTRTAVQQHLAKAGASGPKRLVLYWTGHGVSDGSGSRLLLTPDGDGLAADEVASLLTSSLDVPQVVVILDCCDGGSTALEIVGAINAAPRATPGPSRAPAALSLMASTFGTAKVNPVLFAEALTTALRNGPPFGPWPAQSARIPPQDLALAADAWLRRDGAPPDQRVLAVGVEGGTPFFRNPAYRPGLREIVTNGESRVRRDRVLDDLFSWRGHEPSGLYLLTGSIGTGKTETLAQVVAEMTAAAGERLVQADLAVQRTVPALIEVLAPRLDPASGASLEDLVDRVRADSEPLTLVLDALDEAEPVELEEIVTRLVLPLAAAPHVHVVVAVRNSAAGALEGVLRAHCSGFYDLDRDPGATEAIARHVTNVLTTTPESPYAEDPALAGVVASEMAAASDGAFLFATSLANALAREPEVLRPGDVALQRMLGQSAAEAIEDDLRHRFADRAPAVTAVLAPLAWAFGAGLAVTQLWTRMVAAVGLLPRADPPTEEALARLVAEAGAFLRSVQEDGRPVYRLRHAAYGEFLRAATPDEPSAVHDRILGAVRPGTGGWAHADPYALRYAAAHAAEAGTLNDLFADPDMPLHAEPRTTLAAIHRVPRVAWNEPVTRYLTAGARLHNLSPAERIVALQPVPSWRRMPAKNGGRAAPSGRQQPLPRIEPPGRIDWTTVGAALPHQVVHAAGCELESMAVIPPTTASGRRLIAAARRRTLDGLPASISLIDVDTAEVVQELTNSHATEASALAHVGGSDPLLVAGYSNGLVVGWSIRARRIRWMQSTDSGALRITPIDSRHGALLAVADSVSELLLLRPVDGTVVRSIRDHGGIICAAAIPDGGQTVLATATNTSWLEFWDMDTFAKIAGGELQEPWTGMVTVTVAGRLLLVGARSDGRLELLDGRTRQRIDVTRQETGNEITDICVLDAAAPYPLIATADGRQITLWSWSATTFQRQTVLHGHTDAITWLATLGDGADHDLVASASEDGTARLWSSRGMDSRFNLADHDERGYGDIFSGAIRGHRVVVAAETWEADVLDADTGVLHHRVPDNIPGQVRDRIERVDAVAETTGELLMLTGDEVGDRLWGLSDGRRYGAPARPAGAGSVVVATRPGYPVLFTGTGKGPIRAVDFFGHDHGEVPGGQDGVPVLAVTGPDGPGVLVQWSDRFGWFDTTSRTWQHILPLPWQCQALAAAPVVGGPVAVAVSRRDSDTRILRSDGGDLPALPDSSRAATVLDLDGVPMFALASGELIVVVRPADGTVVLRFPLPGPVNRLCSVDRNRLAALVGECVMTVRFGRVQG
ncbi:hypothetical protein [Virgisporangium aurantiacum]|uniref:WD40 repeat n=1 Tax=Virgisporangium aurantiacum TaxID=175570 RepID=A0A8J3Z2P6_9ACTN|nr:hypothetical protein [Virgisporangium aurantiacum]GIJ56174.1 hypothetical protein Vau01_036900 [Virgisporangium aurantiacum]